MDGRSDEPAAPWTAATLSPPFVRRLADGTSHRQGSDAGPEHGHPHAFISSPLLTRRLSKLRREGGGKPPQSKAPAAQHHEVTLLWENAKS